MEYVGIFIFGVAVSTIVIAACSIIVFGIITEKQEREKLEAQQAADLAPDRKPETP